MTFTFKIKYLFNKNIVRTNIKKYKRLPCQLFIRSNLRTRKSFVSFLKLSFSIVANFTNQRGLKQIGNSTFIETAASGKVELGQASEDGFGQILSGSLERSNVDITEELVNLITSQRNYQAAAKAIETSTSMTQTIINIRN